MIAELGSLWSGPTLCGPVRQWVIQSWVEAVWSSSLWSGPTLCGRVRQYVVQGLVDVVWSYSLWFGPTLCSPVLQSLSDLVIVGLEENVRVIY